mmetsp:Transcript_19670/g.34880  ORF Transcript_19670/g.34880 Transcript_19670/m.34880 type:complete len:567 (-) Transcript_19670:194-1894(-)|eukprot:CAMPEP_0197652018 /NCGR_PEP_ID=MMETSP1338-20131121/34193_1 /TAXON_ID=43686 ORGANISM="Pelagodinium beii, Strain RCC1491" /NCGR_SAMPLE_ID=MMETSP1338 /ASSEMBLY_ACC=CAM_ASM_000754 /LENGTH=566 /DNA_ID=CAMNT_0043226803 /DNA_START=76 /DNA_END=1776 /DNA_ORIENTATION=-
MTLTFSAAVVPSIPSAVAQEKELSSAGTGGTGKYLRAFSFSKAKPNADHSSWSSADYSTTCGDARLLISPEWEDLRPLHPWPRKLQSTSHADITVVLASMTSGPSYVADVKHGKLEVRTRPGARKAMFELNLFWSTLTLLPEPPAQYQTGMSKRDIEESSIGYLSIRHNSSGWLFTYQKSQQTALLSALAKEGCLCPQFQHALQIGEQLAAGSCGVVRIATVTSNPNRRLAVKEFHKEKEAERECRQEVEMLWLAGSHPCILNFHGAFIQRNKWCMVMDVYECGDIWHYSVGQRGLQEKHALLILHCVLSALSHLHKLQIFHRDVKPENVLLSDHGRAVLADFSIATLITDKAAMRQPRFTMVYASPEMLEGTVKDYAGDVYGAGATFYFMVSLQAPFLRNKTERIDVGQETTPGIDFTNNPRLSKLGTHSQDLMKLLLSREAQRPSAAAALNHTAIRPWRVAPWTHAAEGSTMLGDSLCEELFADPLSLHASDSVEQTWKASQSQGAQVPDIPSSRTSFKEKFVAILPKWPRARMPSISMPRFTRRKNQVSPADHEADPSARYAA